MAISITRAAGAVAFWVGISSLLVAGCQMSGRAPDARAATAPAAAPAAAPVKAEKGGAELWAETCSHCHNLRSPSTYGPKQWEVVVMDMRIRAHLTGEEQRKILEFLKSASQ